MVYKITIISDEVDDFIRVIDIDAEATFLELHNAIIKSVQYDSSELTSFFICSDDWEKEQEITMIEMESSSEFDNFIMEKTALEELLIDEKQKFMFTYDMLSDRSFFMELTEIIPGKNIEKAKCVKKTGNAPQQIEDDFDIDSIIASAATTTIPKQNLHIEDSDDSFYGEIIDDDLDSFDLNNNSIDELM